MLTAGLLGALIALTLVPLYAVYAGRGIPWGLSQIEDQTLAGLIMWIPAGFAHLGAGLGLLRHWLGRLDETKNGPARLPRTLG